MHGTGPQAFTPAAAAVLCQQRSSSYYRQPGGCLSPEFCPGGLHHDVQHQPSPAWMAIPFGSSGCGCCGDSGAATFQNQKLTHQPLGSGSCFAAAGILLFSASSMGTLVQAGGWCVRSLTTPPARLDGIFAGDPGPPGCRRTAGWAPLCSPGAGWGLLVLGGFVAALRRTGLKPLRPRILGQPSGIAEAGRNCGSALVSPSARGPLPHG